MRPQSIICPKWERAACDLVGKNASFQFLVFLLKVGVVIGERVGWRWVCPLEPWDLIGNFVVDGTNPLRTNSYSWANQEAAEESCKGTTNSQQFTHVESPIEHACVVRDAKRKWMWIVIDFLCSKHDEWCAVVQYNGHIFKTVDWDERLVWIVLEV